VVTNGAKVEKFIKQKHKQNAKVEPLTHLDIRAVTKGDNDGYAQKEQRFFKKEEEQRIQEEVTWIKDYFISIRKLCPWSLKFWMEEKILHIKSTGKCELTWCACFTASKHEAMLIEYPQDTSIDKLYGITEKIEKRYPELIAFWSHPSEKENNTPKPCVIVQDRRTLTDLRKQIGFEHE